MRRCMALMRRQMNYNRTSHHTSLRDGGSKEGTQVHKGIKGEGGWILHIGDLHDHSYYCFQTAQHRCFELVVPLHFVYILFYLAFPDRKSVV